MNIIHWESKWVWVMSKFEIFHEQKAAQNKRKFVVNFFSESRTLSYWYNLFCYLVIWVSCPSYHGPLNAFLRLCRGAAAPMKIARFYVQWCSVQRWPNNRVHTTTFSVRSFLPFLSESRTCREKCLHLLKSDTKD